ncbi:AAA family ATPase [Gemella cuniculi]|uniref:AAA family ATPase n=1 Tax=Gemella cuniculi TaxID=150240 RepID=UPI0003F4B92C|nr:AAA family ATPase [Gemella cuniculi]
MKPIRLELREFGPYKYEIIDWSKIIDEPIFLITGKTGSGKSTLFDAMTYALYNKTTGGKDISSLRTKTADDKDRTIVIFDFELKNNHYRIERTLAYLKQGNKNLTSAKVVLMEIFDNETKIIATKEQEVKEKIEQLIGLDDKQFCQIIILPQGKFKEFLLSKSSEKKETLRSLFDTYFYQKFVDRLQEYSKQLDGDYKIKERELINRFGQFDFETNLSNFEFLKEDNFQEVKEFLAIQERTVKVLDVELQKKEMELAILQKEYTELDKLNDKFITLNNLVKDFEKLSKDKDKILELKKLVEKLEELEKNKTKIFEYDKLIKKIGELEKDKASLEKENLLHKLDIEENKKLKKSLDKVKEEIKCNRSYISKTAYFYNNIEHYATAFSDKKDYSEKIKNLEADKKKLDFLNEDLKKLNDQFKNLSNDRDKLNNNLINLKLEILKKESEVEKLEKYNELELEIVKELEEIETQKVEIISLEEQQESVKLEVEKLERNKNQEILNTFLEKLHDGDNCPLCKQKIEHLPKIKKENFIGNNENLKIDLDKITTDLITLRVNFKKNQENLNKLELNKVDQERFLNKEANSELKELKAKKEITDKKLEINNESLKDLADEIAFTEEKINILSEKLIFEDEYKEKLSLANSKVNQYQESIDIRTDEFEKYYKKIETQVLLFEKDIEKYKNVESKLLIKEKELEVELKNNKKNLEEVTFEKIEFDKNFENSKLQLYYSTIEVAKENLSAVEKLDVYRNEILEFEDKEKLTVGNITRLEKELSDREQPNLEESNLKVLKKEQEVNDVKEEVVSIKNTFKSNKILYKILYKEFKLWKENVRESREILGLSNVISGKTDSKKSLETYVQGYYLDLILEAATKRLLQMTNDRYSFERRIERSKGGGLQGLDIEIHDIYLNSTRVVNSLSGGELFLASLSLALGLAEVIQNESGGISLETIFIDEGFGSLDTETLDVAISTLIDLQSYGRNIGIISHVSELKENIRPKMEVYSENNYAKIRITGI